MDNWNLALVREWLVVGGLRFRIWDCAWAWAWTSDCAADAIAGLADCRDTRQSVRARLRVDTWMVVILTWWCLLTHEWKGVLEDFVHNLTIYLWKEVNLLNMVMVLVTAHRVLRTVWVLECQLSGTIQLYSVRSRSKQSARRPHKCLGR